MAISTFNHFIPSDNYPLQASFEANLRKWVDEADSAEKPGREEAEERILNCKDSTSLSLASLGLTTLPDLSGTQFESLIVSDNQLSHLSSVCLPTSIVLIFANGNRITSIDLNSLPLLTHLYLSYNRLSQLSLNCLPNSLVRLEATDNRLTGVLDFSHCANLSAISLSDNELTAFPAFRDGANLHGLNLSRNPLQIFPADERLPRVNYYFGSVPASEEGRRRLQVGPSTEMLRPSGKFIAAQPFFPKERAPLIAYGNPDGAVMGTKLPGFITDLGAKPTSIALVVLGAKSDELKKQVHSALFQLTRGGFTEESIPQALLSSVDPSSPIGKIQAYAAACIAKVHGLVLPGGPNIEREFYDLTAMPSSTANYQRSITEFALADAARKTDKPVYGICRGAQLLNVFYGGTLRDQGQSGWQPIDLADSSRKQEVQQLIEGTSAPAFSAHHQCCDWIAPSLEVVMKSGDIPKFLVSQNGKVVASQGHLEEKFEGQYSIGYRLLKIFCDAVPSAPKPIRARL